MTSPEPDAQSRCLYDILNVPRDATPDAIRSSYRRLALQLHPDKLASSSVSPQAATAAFQSLLHAYQVLSDPRERAYYDSHRSQILFSNPTGKGSSNSSFDLDLFSFFSSSAFSGFSDTGKGFYKVYSDAFDEVYETEVRFAKAMGMPVDSVPPPPLMGNLESPYEQVTAFYSYWMRFLTVLDFAWVDKYDAASGLNRRDRRAMEEENKKLRKKAKREYNDSVRGLAAFVKKRDKRVVDMAAKRSAEEERRRAEEKERKKEMERRRMEQARLYKDQEWAEVEEVEEVEEVVEESHDDDEKSRELYCVVCSKKFKSEKQWKNHEQSRKHRDKVVELRESLLKEETSEEEDGFRDEVQVAFDYVPAVDEEDDIVDGLCEEFDNVVEVETEKGGVLPSQDEESGLSVDEEKDSVLPSQKKEPELSVNEEEDVLEAMISGIRNRSAGNLDQSDISSSKGLGVDSEEEANAKYASSKKGQKSKPRRRAKGKTNKENLKNPTSQGSEDVTYANHQVEDDENVAESSDRVQEAKTNSKLGNGIGNNQQPKKKQNEGKAAVKKEKDPVPNNRSKGKKQKGESKSSNNACGTCGESFESRNKLFVHLGETGHVTLKIKSR